LQTTLFYFITLFCFLHVPPNFSGGKCTCLWSPSVYWKLCENRTYLFCSQPQNSAWLIVGPPDILVGYWMSE
jgi:hypothetical protein